MRNYVAGQAMVATYKTEDVIAVIAPSQRSQELRAMHCWRWFILSRDKTGIALYIYRYRPAYRS